MSFNHAEETISAEQSKRGMRMATIAQCTGVHWMYAFAYAGLATLYARQFGAQDFMVGLIIGSFMIGMAAVVFGPDLVERYNKRPVLFGSAIVGCIVVLPILFLPQIAHATGAPAALWIFAVSMLLTAIATAGFVAAWFPITKDFVPEHRTGRFFGRLRMAWQLVLMALYLCFSLCIKTREEATPAFYQWFLGVLFLGQVIRLFILPHLPQRPIRSLHKRGVLSRIRLLFSERRFRGFLLSAPLLRGMSLWIFPTLIIYGALLGANDTILLVSMLARMLGSALTFPMWGRVVDRAGPGSNYRRGLLITSVALLLWVPTTLLALNGNSQMLFHASMVFSFFLWGTGDAAINIAFTRHSFRLTSPERAPTYLALLPGFTTVSIGLGQVLAGLVFSRLQPENMTRWLNPYVIGISLCAVFALSLIPLVSRIPGAGPQESD